MRVNLKRTTSRMAGVVSRKRRGRFAAPVVLLLGLLVTGGAYAALSPADAAGARQSDTNAVAKGRALYQVGCASCHGLGAQGITTKKGGQYGPPLAGVGAAAVDFQVGTGRMPLAAPGVQAPVKPRIYSQQEIDQLAAYIASLAPGPSTPTKADYDASGATGSELTRGGELFRKNCTACHNFAGSGGALPGGKYAPKISDVSSKRIFEALLTGPQQMPVFSNDVLTPQDKRNIISYLRTNEKSPGYGGFSMGALGPVSEGLFAWLAGIGVLVGFAVWIAAHSARVKKKPTPVQEGQA